MIQSAIKRLSFEDSKLGYYDIVNPSYTIFNNNSKTFSSIYTEYNDDFNLFYNNCIEDIKTYSISTSFSPKACNIKNLFNISSIPWVSFEGFNLNINNCFDYLPPIFTIGKYFNDSKQNCIILQPANDKYSPIIINEYNYHEFKIIGKLALVISKRN